MLSKVKPDPIPGTCTEMAFTLLGRGSPFPEKLDKPVSGRSRCLLVNICGESGGVLPEDLAKYTSCASGHGMSCTLALNPLFPFIILCRERTARDLIKTSCGFIV